MARLPSFRVLLTLALTTVTFATQASELTGANPTDVPELLAGAAFPQAKAQPQLLQQQTPAAIAETALFLKEQGKVETVLPDYAPFVSARFVQ